MSSTRAALSKISSQFPRSRSAESTALRTTSSGAAGSAQPRSEPRAANCSPISPAFSALTHQNHVILVPEPVRILDRHLGLSDAAHSTQCLDHRPIPGLQHLPNSDQQSLTAGEPEVPSGAFHPLAAHPACARYSVMDMNIPVRNIGVTTRRVSRPSPRLVPATTHLVRPANAFSMTGQVNR